MLRPKSEADLADAIKGAEAPLSIQGGGTRTQSGDADLTTAGLSGIEIYEPGALTIVVRAGTPLAEVEEALAAENQRLAFEPMDHRGLLGTEGTPTIGGVVSANVSGPRRVSVGACRDFMLGVRFVDGAGTILKNGGRVMKNVTGYDLVKLLTGAQGTLGVLTEVSLKVLPKPDTEATLVLHDLSPDAAVAAMSDALGSPFEVTGAASAAGKTILRIEGFDASVSYRAGRLQDVLRAHGDAEVVDAAQSAALWTDTRDVTAFAGQPGAVWRISARPSQAAGILATLPDRAQWQLDWGGGLIWVLCDAEIDLRASLGHFDGHSTRVRGDGPAPARQPEAAAIAALSAGLRTKFDPRGILNSGRMG